jgi:hypothetical protein
MSPLLTIPSIFAACFPPDAQQFSIWELKNNVPKVLTQSLTFHRTFGTIPWQIENCCPMLQTLDNRQRIEYNFPVS